jgi:hypothetical protein
MDALLVEAVPTRALGSFAEAFTILRPVIIDDVVLARHVKHVASFATLQDFLKRVELLGFREVSQVAGVQHEGRSPGQRIDLRDRLRKVAATLLLPFEAVWLSLIWTAGSAQLASAARQKPG